MNVDMKEKAWLQHIINPLSVGVKLSARPQLFPKTSLGIIYVN